MDSKVPSLAPSMDPSSALSMKPSSIPSNNPSSEPTCYGGKDDGKLEYVGNTECTLEECAGDCDEDSDCVSGLMCFQRKGDNQKKVPGCKGKSITDINYCIKVRNP